MAVFYRMVCKVPGCGIQVINHEQSKSYVHAGMAPERQPHKPEIHTIKTDDTGKEVAA